MWDKMGNLEDGEFVPLLLGDGGMDGLVFCRIL